MEEDDAQQADEGGVQRGRGEGRERPREIPGFTHMRLSYEIKTTPLTCRKNIMTRNVSHLERSDCAEGEDDDENDWSVCTGAEEDPPPGLWRCSQFHRH